MALHAVKTLETNVVVPGYGPVPNAQTTVTIDETFFDQIPASMFSGNHLQDMGGVPDPTDAVSTQAANVPAPAALTTTQTAGATYTTTEQAMVNALKADVTALRGTVAALLTALTGTGKPMHT
jgi:hypothetical protein